MISADHSMWGGSASKLANRFDRERRPRGLTRQPCPWSTGRRLHWGDDREIKSSAEFTASSGDWAIVIGTVSPLGEASSQVLSPTTGTPHFSASAISERV